MKRKVDFEPKWIVVALFFITGIFVGSMILFVWVFNGGNFYGIQKIHYNSGIYKYINPLLAIDVQGNTSFLEDTFLQSSISNAINKAKNQGLMLAAVYFRDIETGNWTGVNQDLKFSPGLLLKLPIAIAYYKEAEASPKILQKQVVYNYDSNNSDMVRGEVYSLEDLINEMILNDDDATANALFDNLNTAYLNEVYADLGYEIKENKTDLDFTTLKHSALIYRILYNSTYLSREMSEKFLGLLSQTGKSKGFAGGLPNDLVIAHRYHEVNDSTGTGGQDCGIIYYPGHPYELCMMLRAHDQLTAENIFEEISNVVYMDMKNKYN